MEPSMAARDRFEQGGVGARGTRRFALDDQPDFQPASLHLERYEPGHRQAGGFCGIDWFRYQSLYIQRHSDAAAFQLNAIDQVAEVVGDFRVMRELFAFPVSRIERRLQVANR